MPSVTDKGPRALHGLYAITDESLIPDPEFDSWIEHSLAGGVRILQYRNKTSTPATRLAQANIAVELCRRYGAFCIINDDVELALASGADGIHLGRDDVSIRVARARLGGEALIGASCYNSVDLARSAEQEGADYIAFGAVFPSPTKPAAVHADLRLFHRAKTALSVPVCAIGGIDGHNAGDVVAAGADMVAVISALYRNVSSPREISARATHISALFG